VDEVVQGGKAFANTLMSLHQVLSAGSICPYTGAGISIAIVTNGDRQDRASSKSQRDLTRCPCIANAAGALMARQGTTAREGGWGTVAVSWGRMDVLTERVPRGLALKE